MRIGQAAARLGLATHVLRHWEEAGVVVPDRTSTGHRDYTTEQVHRLRILQACQGAGMSLADIRLVLHRDEPGRSAVIDRRLHAIQEQQAHLAETARFLAHVIACEHDLVTRCPGCSNYGRQMPPASGASP